MKKSTKTKARNKGVDSEAAASSADASPAVPAIALPVAPETTRAPRAKRGEDIAMLARQHTRAALEAFVAVMQDASAPAAARVAAATQILTWGYGKASAGESDAGERTVKLAWES
ncbi:MAG: hypothetical protein WD044_12460 [Dongiaceae bacterium]